MFKQHLRKLQNFWLPKMFKFNLQTRKIFLMIRLIGVFLRLGFSRVRQKLYGYNLMLRRLQWVLLLILVMNYRINRPTDHKIQICHKNIKFHQKFQKMNQESKKVRKKSLLSTFQVAK